MAASRTDKAQALHLAVISLDISVIDVDVDAHRESSVRATLRLEASPTHAASVARIERSEIQAQPIPVAMLSPDVASLHPGYKCCSRSTSLAQHYP